MLRKRKEGLGRGRKGHATTARRHLLALFTLVLLIPIQNVSAAVQTTSGTTHMSNTLQYGTTAYSVDYSYPSTARVGTNLTVSVTLHVSSLTGLVEYLYDYRLVVNVYVGPQNVLNGSITGGVIPLFLYAGSTWGPNNVTIPLTAGNTGLAKGASANATLSINLQDTVYIGGRDIALYLTEPPLQGQAGGLLIQNTITSSSTSSGGQGAPQTSQTYVPYALVASGVVLMLLAVFLTRGPRSPKSPPK